MKTYFTSESVTEGHPDKICDQISDAILDNLLNQDPNSRVAVETLATDGLIILAGEVTSRGKINFQEVARETIKDIGYNDPRLGFDYKTCRIIEAIHEQSPDIAVGVDESVSHEQGAGDQGMMFGFASADTHDLMPMPIAIAHRLAQRLSEVRKKGILPYLRPDGKSQATVRYTAYKPEAVDAIVIAAQHDDDISLTALKEEIKREVVEPVLKEFGFAYTTDIKLNVNETGRFVIGGPQGDTGLTGRKIIVDTYGSMGRHGGGAFSGKDPSKVDRSGAYMARYIAKNIVASGLASRCEIQISYAIGVARPLSVHVDTFHTGQVSDELLEKAVWEIFDMRPRAIIDLFNLKRPIYKQVAAYGHFGRTDLDLPWEKTDKVEVLKRDALVEVPPIKV